jgi:hypothetical protein
MSDKVKELMGMIRDYLAVIEGGGAQFDENQTGGIQQVRDQLHGALTGLSQVAMIACNGIPCPLGMQCVGGRCVPPPVE